jgi:hypothetical protein
MPDPNIQHMSNARQGMQKNTERTPTHATIDFFTFYFLSPAPGAITLFPLLHSAQAA